MQASSRRAHRSVGVVVAGAIASALMASCAHGPRAHVLGKVIERSTTTDVASDPASTVSGAGTATTPTTASGTVTTNGGAVTTIAKPRPSTPSPPAATTKTTAAPSPAPTTTPATVAGESLAPGPYLEQSDGSGVLD